MIGPQLRYFALVLRLGVEPSHRRSENHIVCQRVKTFKLIREAQMTSNDAVANCWQARQRNPELVVLASAWTLPAWVGVVNASQCLSLR